MLDGRYRLLREIGRGGAGTVWEAEQLPLGRRVAVKLLRGRTDDAAGARLLREALTVSSIGHDHIVRVDDVGTDGDGTPYVAMELLHGQSVAEVLAARTKLPVGDTAVIVEQLVDALWAAHQVGVVHRDVKPANLFARRSAGAGWHVVLLDFGLCKTATSTRQGLTAAGTLLGTPGYMAPEQIRGALVDCRADQYALGCVVAELLTGRPVFDGSNREDVLRRQLRAVRSRHLEREGIDGAVVATLDRAMAVVPQDRYPDVRAFGAAFAAAVARAERTIVPTRPAKDGTSGWRRGYVLGVLTTVACAVAIAMTVRSPSKRTETESEVGAAVVEASSPPAAEHGRQSARSAGPTSTPSQAPVSPPLLPDLVEPVSAEATAEAREAGDVAPQQRSSAKRRPERASAPVDPASSPEPKPRVLPNGIRDPFMGL